MADVDATSDAGSDDFRRPRKMCAKCLRPTPTGCFCASTPAQPINTRGALVIIRHPHEYKRPLSTSNVMTFCMHRCALVKARAVKDQVAERIANASNVYVLYPTNNARILDEPDDETEHEQDEQPKEQGATPLPQSSLRDVDSVLSGAAFVLVAFDGTWKEAREMHAKSLQALPSHAITVKLNENKKVEDAHNLRVEPDESCTLTALAAARAVAALEAEYGGDATKVRTATQRVVNHIIGIQRMFDPAMQPHITKHLGGGKRQRVGGNHGANSAKGGQVSDL